MVNSTAKILTGGLRTTPNQTSNLPSKFLPRRGLLGGKAPFSPTGLQWSMMPCCWNYG